VIDRETVALLEDIIRRESRSVLLYVGEAFPWTTARDSAALVKVQNLIKAEQNAISTIAEFLQRHRTPITYHGSYPASFTTINFLALKKILPRLVAYERESIPLLQSDLAKPCSGSARALLEKLLAVKRTNLATLEVMIAPQTQNVA
jgi:hypothetical protein